MLELRTENRELRRRRWWFVSLILSSLFLIPFMVHAQGLVPCTGLGEDPCTVRDLFVLLVRVYNLLLGLSALVALLFLVWGGARMLYWGFMEDSASELEAAKFTVRRAISGFAIIALAYLIVNTVIVLLGGGSIAQILQLGGF